VASLIFTSAQILRSLWSSGLTNSKWHAQGLRTRFEPQCLAAACAAKKGSRTHSSAFARQFGRSVTYLAPALARLAGMNDSAAMDPTSELVTTVTQSGPEPEAAATAASDRSTREGAGTLSCVASATCGAEPTALSARGEA